MLDNENYAKRLKVEARKKKSIHQQRRYVTRPEYIKIWRRSFEMDNFSATEIAAALSSVAPGTVRFSRSEVTMCMKGINPMAYLADLYKTKTGGDIPKLQLAERLVDGMLAKGVRRTIESRPIVKTLERVATLAARNILLRCSMYGNTIRPQSISARRDAKDYRQNKHLAISPIGEHYQLSALSSPKGETQKHEDMSRFCDSLAGTHDSNHRILRIVSAIPVYLRLSRES